MGRSGGRRGGPLFRNVVALGGGGGAVGVSQVRQRFADGDVRIATNADAGGTQTVFVSNRTSQLDAVPMQRGAIRQSFGLEAAATPTVTNRAAAAIAAELGPNVRVQVSREDRPREIAVGNQIIRGRNARSGATAEGGGINTRGGELVISISAPRSVTNAQKAGAIQRGLRAVRDANQAAAAR